MAARHRNVIVGLILVAAALAARAPAAGATVLPGIRGDAFVVTDPAHHHVFVSGSGPAVDVLRESGTLQTTVPIDGAAGMVRDGGTLYVLGCRAGEIAVVDLAALTVTDRISLGDEPSAEPCGLALAAGRLWYPSSTPGGSQHLSSVTVAAPHDVAHTGYEIDEGLVGSPAGGGTIVGADTGTLMSFDVSTGTATLGPTRGFGGSLFGLVASADGTTVTAAQNVPVMSIPGLTDVSGYPPTGDAAALSENAGWIAVATLHRIAVTARNVAEPVATERVPAGLHVAKLAFSPDLTRLYAVYRSPTSGQVSFEAIAAPTLPRPAVSLVRSRNIVVAGQAVALRATLSVADPAGVIQFWRTRVGGSPVLVARQVLGADRIARVVVRPKSTSAYVARFVPDARYGPADSPAARVQVHVRVDARMLGGYGTSGRYRVYRYTSACTLHGRGCPTMRGTVFPNHAGKRATARVEVYAGGRWHTVLSGRLVLGRRSAVTLRLIYRTAAVVGVPTRVNLSFPRDADHLGGRSAWAYFKVTS